MKEFSYLALPIVGGYAFATIWIGSLIFASRESGDRLYFRAVFYGAWLYVCALALHIILFTRFTSYPSFVAAVGMLDGEAVSEAGIFDASSKLVIAFLSYILGPLFGVN